MSRLAALFWLLALVLPASASGALLPRRACAGPLDPAPSLR